MSSKTTMPETGQQDFRGGFVEMKPAYKAKKLHKLQFTMTDENAQGKIYLEGADEKNWFSELFLSIDFIKDTSVEDAKTLLRDFLRNATQQSLTKGLSRVVEDMVLREFDAMVRLERYLYVDDDPSVFLFEKFSSFDLTCVPMTSAQKENLSTGDFTVSGEYLSAGDLGYSL